MSEIIKFDSARTNIGGHYSPKTGVFTVPRPGLYMLSATVRAGSGKHLHCGLWVNGVMYERAFGANLSSGTLNVVLQLKKGDRVYRFHIWQSRRVHVWKTFVYVFRLSNSIN